MAPPPAAWAAPARPEVELPELAPPGPPPPQIPDADRLPVPAKGTRQALDPRPDVLPIDLPPGEKLEAVEGVNQRPELGGPSTDVFASGPGETHAAVVYAGDVNVEDSEGRWVEPMSVADDIGDEWQMPLADGTVRFPQTMEPGSPIVLQLSGHEIASELEHVKAAQGKLGRDSITYEEVFPSVDVVEVVFPEGYKEDLVLKDAQAPSSFSYLIDAGGMTLERADDGELQFLDGAVVVAVFPEPVAHDSSADPARSVAHTGLSHLGEGVYRLNLKLDDAFLSDAIYPVVLDPGSTQPVPDRDGWVNQSAPNQDYSGDWDLRVGDGRRTFIRFNVGNLIVPGRLVYQATLSLLINSQGGAAVPTNAKRPTEQWPGQLTWNNQPAVNDPEVYGSGTGENQLDLELKSLYQRYLEGTFPDLGIRLTSDGNKVFLSSENPWNQRPRLQLVWNDLPQAPSLASPAGGATIKTDSPTLAMAGKVSQLSDPNGDPVIVNYQVSESSSFSNVVWQSGWTDEERFNVPSGKLVDGKTFYWRVQSWDGYSLTDGAGQTRAAPSSGHRTFTVRLEHLGDDDRYAMWSQGLGNDMTLGVNQANGNLVLDVPLDTLTTPVDDLGLSFSYNHQEDGDYGLGRGWDVMAGPGSSGRELPTGLTSVPEAEAVAVRFGDGEETWFTKRGEDEFREDGDGASVVHRNADGSYELTTPDGSLFTFLADGTVNQASPVGSSPQFPGKAFRYTFNTSGHLTEIQDAIDRQIAFTWQDVGGVERLTSISAWDGRTWALTYSGGLLESVTTPAQETMSFGYDGGGRVSEV